MAKTGGGRYRNGRSAISAVIRERAQKQNGGVAPAKTKRNGGARQPMTSEANSSRDDSK